MQMSTQSKQLTVQNELDVVNLRQIVRQITRVLGMDLSRQAKITAAISAIARACVLDKHVALFTVQCSQISVEPVLEIICLVTIQNQLINQEGLEQRLHFHETRTLVDECSMHFSNNVAHLKIRMHLEKPDRTTTISDHSALYRAFRVQPYNDSQTGQTTTFPAPLVVSV